MPTVCGLCPVGCNISATTREGKVKRIQSRNHPEIDEGWLCDKGRFAFAHLRRGRPDHDAAPQGGPRRFEAIALGRRARRGRAAAARRRRRDRHRALRRRDRSRRPTGSRSCCAAGSARTPPCCPRSVPDGLDAFRAPLSALRDAKRRSSCSATSRSSSARRSSTCGSRPRGAPAPTISYRLPERAAVDAARHRRRRARRGSRGSTRRTSTTCRFTPNGRGVADAWSAAGDGEPDDGEPHAADRLGRRGGAPTRRARAGRSTPRS